LWLAAGALALIVFGLSVELFLPLKERVAPVAVKRPATQTQAQPALRVEPLPMQSAEASGAPAASMRARTHSDVDQPVVEDAALVKRKDTLADVPEADDAVELEQDEAATASAARSGKARSHSRSTAAARRARARNYRHYGAHKRESMEPEPEPELAGAGVYALPEAAGDDVLRRAPAFPSVAAAKRAHGSGKLSTAAYEAVVGNLKARRQRRIAIEQQNLAQGKITTQEYEWRLGRIDQEYRGE
jgi:hypothetical protein